MAERTKGFLTPGDDLNDQVEVDIVDGLTEADVASLDRAWDGPMSQLVVELTATGFNSNALPPSWAWTWEEIIAEEQQPEWSIIGIEHNNAWQGILVVDTHPCPCVHDPGNLGVYVAYIGTAPWNMGFYLNRVGQTPTFDDVGYVLFVLAVMKSFECNLNGRVVLHAAKGSEGFFRKCGITEIGPDATHPNSLVRFEVSADQAKLISGQD